MICISAKHSITSAMIIGMLTLLYQVELSAQNTTVSNSKLIEAEGWRQVQANCTECHSAQMIIQNSGNKAVWKSRILWMQETQGLGELSPETEKAILNYLATNYGQKEASRRSGLPAHLMPTNPLESKN